MEMEQLEPRVKPLAFKVRAVSRESSPSQKAAHVLDPDLRSHWSAGTNTKEWILLELEEPCLLSHIRIYNKSVLEWEITVGLRYKPETFVKVRPRCEAPRRDMIYPMNYTACRFVRISCLRGNPIAVFFIQLIGVTVKGLEPEFQPVINYLLPHIMSHKQDAHDMHLQLLQDIADRLLVFLPHLEVDLTNFTEAAESSIQFLAMLAGPFYPILQVVKERETTRALFNIPDSEALRTSQASCLTVSSNFEVPRKLRSPAPSLQLGCSSIAFRPDLVFMLLRKAYKDPHLGHVCRLASRALQKLFEPTSTEEGTKPAGDFTTSMSDDSVKTEAPNHLLLNDYSSLFGEDFRIPDDQSHDIFINLLDVASVEEGIFHILYACTSQPLLCCKLAESNAGFLSILPLIQALLPAFRPPFGIPPDQINDSFSQWNHPLVQRALSQIVALSSPSVYCPLLHACAGYLSSFSTSQAKAACVLIDLCCGVLAPWLPVVTAKVDLAIELLEDLLGIVQGAPNSITRSLAALKCITLALSGHMDDILPKYKKVKHKVLFLLEMLDPFLAPAMTAVKNTIAFGDVSTMFAGKQEETCAIALNIIRTAVQKPAVLPSLEHEWRRGSVAPSVLLSILGPNMPLPPEIDLCKCLSSKVTEEECPSTSLHNSVHGLSSKSGSLDESDGKVDSSEVSIKVDAYEDGNLLFAPPELKNTTLRNVTSIFDENKQDSGYLDPHDRMDEKNLNNKMPDSHFKEDLSLDSVLSIECLNLQADYLQLVNFEDCKSRALEFQGLALDLHSQGEISPEGHDAAIDALLLAAECYVNPFFMMSKSMLKHLNLSNNTGTRVQNRELMGLRSICQKNCNSLDTIVDLERKRDKIVLDILIQAAELDQEYQQKLCQGVNHMYMEKCSQNYEVTPFDMQFADSVTLVRQNQVLLCHFVMQYLQKDQPNLHEILLQSLLILLQSATELFCPPEDVIDVILQSAEHLNGMLTSFYYQLKEGNLQLVPEKLHGIQRRWMLLQKLVIASSAVDDEIDSAAISRNGFQYTSLVSPSSWFQRIPVFSTCPFPLVRFVGWMAVSRLAKKCLNDRLLLSQDVSHLTLLLSFFADELAQTENIVAHNVEALNLEQTGVQRHLHSDKSFGSSDTSNDQRPFHILYPDLCRFFPMMKKRFATFGDIILQAVCLQLRSFPSTAVPDVLCWFSDLCLSPFLGKGKGQSSVINPTGHSRGFSATNMKAIILYVLEAIITEHLEAMLPEMPRVSQILVSLCRSSYCDVTFLGAVLALLKPLISYALDKSVEDESLLIDDLPSCDLESLCFEEFFSYMKCKKEHQYTTGDQCYNGQLVIFILGALFPSMSLMRKRHILQSLSLWTDFTAFVSTTSFYDYLLAFQCVMDSCNIFLAHSLEDFGMSVPFHKPQFNIKSNASSGEHPDLLPNFLDDVPHSFLLTANAVEVGVTLDTAGLSYKSGRQLGLSEIEDICASLEDLILKLCPAVEACWSLHFKLSKKLAVAMAKCLMLLKCLTLVSHSVGKNKDGDTGDICQRDLGDISSKNWVDAVERLTEAILTNQQNHCWQVSSCMLDYVFELPLTFSLNSMEHICSVIKSFCCLAPRISWRLQADKWLFSLFKRDISSHDHLVDLFGAMLGHWEPEQRYTALKHLAILVGLDVNDRVSKLSCAVKQSAFTSDPLRSVRESVISSVVYGTWDRVAAVASSDPSILLRAHAMALLSGYVPFAGQGQLQSFLVAADALPGLGKHARSTQEGSFIRLSLGLLANACLHSPAEDISLLPEVVWQRLDSMAMSKTGGLGNIEKNICKALCQLRTEKDGAKEALKEVVSMNSIVENRDPELKGIRESILQVVSSLTSVQAYFDFFSNKCEQEAQELDEAEIELELLQKERAHHDVSGCSVEEIHPLSAITDNTKDGCRLQQIKDEIRSIERSKLREEIAARRQKKLLVRRNRQKYVEEATLREMELLQELDGERTNEAEREIERQRLLELERAKTRELRYNLDMERERQAQRDLQRELEQVESGVRTSRRDFSSNPNRARDRYRERENGRMGAEGSLRPSSRGQDSATSQTSTSTNLGTSVPTLVLAGSRTFSGQPPTILQPRERPDERGMVYEDNYEGSRDSGDASSVGDPDVVSSLDPGGFVSGPRQGRGSKSRQIVERRDRDGRREGKWERKHS